MINKRQVQNIFSQCFNLTIFFRNFVISCFQEFRKWLQHSIFSGNFTRVEKSWILFKTKFKSSIPNINYLAPLFMHCYSCSKITILVLLSPRHLKWHIWLRVRGCAYVWLLQIYTRFWILITSLPPIFSGKSLSNKVKRLARFMKDNLRFGLI